MRRVKRSCHNFDWRRGRPSISRKRSGNSGAAEQFVAAHDVVDQASGGGAHLGDMGDDDQLVIEPRRAVPGDIHFVHGIISGAFCHHLGMNDT